MEYTSTFFDRGVTFNSKAGGAESVEFYKYILYLCHQNHYIFHVGEALIWKEAGKLSPALVLRLLLMLLVSTF